MHRSINFSICSCLALAPCKTIQNRRSLCACLKSLTRACKYTSPSPAWSAASALTSPTRQSSSVCDCHQFSCYPSRSTVAAACGSWCSHWVSLCTRPAAGSRVARTDCRGMLTGMLGWVAGSLAAKSRLLAGDPIAAENYRRFGSVGNESLSFGLRFESTALVSGFTFWAQWFVR